MMTTHRSIAHLPEAPSLSAEARPAWLLTLELAGALAFVLMVLAVAEPCIEYPFTARAGALITVAALLAWVAADLASGTVHWLCDTFFAEDTPIVGRAIITPFREHHRDPLALTRRGFFEVNSSNYLALLPILAGALWWQHGREAGPSHVFPDAFLVCFVLATAITNQIHKWAHAREVAAVVAWLQGVRLILTPAGHAAHHDTGARAFCITTGWLNPLLDRGRVFPRAERGIRALRCLVKRRTRSR